MLSATLAEEQTVAAVPGADLEPLATPIIYLLSQYPALTHTYLLREVLELRKLGMNIHVASVRPPDRPIESLQGSERDEADSTFYVKPEGFGSVLWTLVTFILVHPIRCLRGLAFTLRLSRQDPGKFLSHLFYLVEAVIVGCWMKNKNSTHVHTHFSSTVALVIKKMFPITFSMTIHGPEEFDAIAFHLDEKMAAADFVFSISYYSQSQLMRVSSSEYWHKITVIPLGVDPSIYVPAPRPLEEAPFRLMCVARLAPVKAQTILLQAVHRLLDAGRNVEVHLVGGGQDLDRLEREAKRLKLGPAVVFHGPMPQSRVVELLATAHVFTLASFAEGVPVALMEAMALGVPCVSTCLMGIPELIRHKVDGLLVPPSDIESLAEAIEELMDNPALRDQYAKSGRQHVQERYDLRRNTRTMAALFRDRLA